jgi:hypothetical protein
MWIWTRGQEKWNSSPNIIEMKVAKDGSTKLAIPILLRMLMNNVNKFQMKIFVDFCRFAFLNIWQGLFYLLLNEPKLNSKGKFRNFH